MTGGRGPGVRRNDHIPNDIARLLTPRPAILDRTLWDFIAADTWTASRRVLEQHQGVVRATPRPAGYAPHRRRPPHVGAQGTAPDETPQSAHPHPGTTPRPPPPLP
ncbi:MAG: hypothetical protein Q9O62_11195 [Ardenticatenia bacterium]|nr:hypothetical protein [Ardenticatenia bacterium]